MQGSQALPEAMAFTGPTSQKGQKGSMAVGLKLEEGLKTNRISDEQKSPILPQTVAPHTGVLLSELGMNTEHEQILMSKEMSVNVT